MCHGFHVKQVIRFLAGSSSLSILENKSGKTGLLQSYILLIVFLIQSFGLFFRFIKFTNGFIDYLKIRQSMFIVCCLQLLEFSSRRQNSALP